MNNKKAIGLLQLALNSTSGDPSLSEVRHHIKQAMSKLEAAEHRRNSGSSQTQYQKWWGNIVAGSAAQPISREAAMRSLKDLNDMISAEQKKIHELEQKSQPTNPGLLKD